MAEPAPLAKRVAAVLSVVIACVGCVWLLAAEPPRKPADDEHGQPIRLRCTIPRKPGDELRDWVDNRQYTVELSPQRLRMKVTREDGRPLTVEGSCRLMNNAVYQLAFIEKWQTATGPINHDVVFNLDLKARRLEELRRVASNSNPEYNNSIYQCVELPRK